MKYCCVLVDFLALPGEFLPTEWQSPSGGREQYGPGPGGHGRAAVDEPRVTANWNERVSGALSPRLTRMGRRLGIADKQPGRTTVTTTACFRGNSNLSFPT